MEGTGITIFPEISVKTELEAGKLTKLSWFEDPIRANVLMIYIKQKWMPPNLQACIDTFHGLLNGI